MSGYLAIDSGGYVHKLMSSCIYCSVAEFLSKKLGQCSIGSNVNHPEYHD